MILSNIEIFWNDQWLNGPTTVEGTVRTETIQLTGIIGTPQYRLKSTDGWTDLDVDGLFYRFEILKSPDSYELEIQDSGDPGAISVLDFEIKSKTTKCGRENFIDVVNYLQITGTQISFDTTYLTLGFFDNGYVEIDSTLIALPNTELWADVGSPLTTHYEHHARRPEDLDCTGPNFTAYQPASGSPCDLVVASPTITQPNKDASDGIIQINATSSGTITYKLDDGLFQSSNIFSGLPQGEYVVTIHDDTGNCTDVEQEITLTEKYFRIPKLNAVEFKIFDSNRANLNNTLFNEMKLPYRVLKNNFCQTYFDDELLPVQFQSTFVSHTITVRNYITGATLATIVPILVYDSPENFQYWEFTINLSLYPDTTIQVTIVPEGETLVGGNAGISEPLEIISEDANNEFVKVQYSSNKNHSDIYWRSGFTPFLYVRGQVASALPQINKEISMDCKWNLNTQSRELKRLIDFKVKQQPYYVFEKLIWALGNGQGPGNFYFVNDVSVNSEDAGFEEPDFPEKYSLADSEAKLQEKDVFAGDLSTTPTPVETVNYLLVNPLDDGGLLVSPDDEITFV